MALPLASPQLRPGGRLNRRPRLILIRGSALARSLSANHALAFVSVIAGGIALALAATAVPVLRRGHFGPVEIVAWVGLIPAVGVAGGLSERLRRSAAVQRSVDEERHRIARDLHDGVAQALAHLRLELDLISRRHAEVRSDTDRLSRVAERALADVRCTLSGLRASRNLVSALGAYLDDLQGPSQPNITFEGSHADLSPDVEAEVYRVAQEAVSNAVRHADAAEVRVCLETGEKTVVLSVSDDGRGIPDIRRRGVGLSSMSERAARIGGNLVVDSRPGGGTRIVLEVPR